MAPYDTGSGRLPGTPGRPSMRSSQLERLTRRHYLRRLEEDRTARYQAPDSRPAAAGRVEALRKALAAGDHSLVVTDAEAIATEATVPAIDARGFRLLCEYLLRAELEAAQRAIERDQGIYWGRAQDPLFADLSADDDALDLNSDGELTVTALMEKYLAEKRCGAKTVMHHRSAAALFEEVVGKKSIRDHDRADVLLFKDVLLQLPRRYRCGGKEVAALDEAGACAGQPLSPTTVNSNYLGPIRGLFDYALERGALPGTVNIAAHIRHRGRAAVHACDKRLPLTQGELDILWHSPLFTGSFSPARYDRPGPHLHSCWRFWLPLVIYLMGLRPNELGQAVPADVRYASGWPCLLVTGESADGEEAPTRHVKTAAAERMVPIHPELIRLGFLDMIESQHRRRSARIFPVWRAACDGTYSSTASHFFNQAKSGYLVKLGIKRPRTALYSLRHNFKDSLRRTGLSDDQQNLLMGHAGSVYGSRELPTVLLEAYLQLDLGGINLRHIVPRGCGRSREIRFGGGLWRFEGSVIHVGRAHASSDA